MYRQMKNLQKKTYQFKPVIKEHLPIKEYEITFKILNVPKRT